jgi:hypothetical protein
MSQSARRAMAIRWMMALVEHPIAMATAMAFPNASRVWMRCGVRSSHTISTMRRPDSEASRMCPASAAGIEEPPGRTMPTASAMAVMVLAVPMVMQVP